MLNYLVAATFLLISFPAFGQETIPGSACTAGEVNFIRQSGGPETSGVVNLMRCDGSLWQRYLGVNSDGAVETGERLISQNSDSNNPSLTLDDSLKLGINGNGHSILFDRQGTTHFKVDTLGGDATFGPGNASNGELLIGWSNPTVYLGSQDSKLHLGAKVLLYSDSEGDSLGWTRANFGIAIDNSTNTSRADILDTVFYIDNTSKHVGIGTISPSAELEVAGDIFYSGIMRDVSDRKLKTDIYAIGASLDKVTKLEGVSFVMKDDTAKRREYGLIAQDVMQVFPELVDAADTGTLGLNYMGLFAPLIESTKELDQINKQQNIEIESLKAINSDLHQKLYKLSHRIDVLEGKTRPPLKPYNK